MTGEQKIKPAATHNLPRLVLCSLMAMPSMAQAAGACFASSISRPQLTLLPQETMQATASSIVGAPTGSITLEGDVLLQYTGTALQAQKAVLNTQTMEVATEGEATLFTQQLNLKADEFSASLQADTMSVSNASFEFFGESNYMRGRSEQFDTLSKDSFALRNASITSCAEQSETWRLRASSITIDNEAGRGMAEDVRFELGGVPLMYVPWLSWPLNDERQSGLLYPRLSFSDSTGWEIRQPWYWNIAPNADATFTPRYMDKRGLQLLNEFRYLTPRTRWQLDYEYLNDTQLDERRQFVRLTQTGTLDSHWSTEVSISDASDGDYFDDLGSTINVANISHLDRRIDLRFSDGTSSGLFRLQAHQTLDETLDTEDRPYKRLPQILWNSTPWDPNGPLSLEVEGEAVQLTRDDSVKTWRVDMRPRMQFERSANWGFFKGAATIAHTRYWLSDEDEAQDSTFDRTVPILSLDAGTRLRRNMPGNATQTLEPRFFYLFVPDEDQSELPLFDTAELDFSYDQLFRENRFSGRDRIGDANQISLAVTTRYLDNTGDEVWRASVGSAFYLDDQDVNLSDDEPVSGRSDIVGEALYSGHRNWQLRAIAQFGADGAELERSGIDLRYRTGDKLINFGHRLQRDRLEQVDVSFAWPFDNGFTLLGRAQHSLQDSRSIEQLLGFSWDSCCWTFRASASRTLDASDDIYENEYTLEMVFKGLGGLGNNVGAEFERAILGYEDFNN